MSADSSVPEFIGHYRIVSELGRGGMGVVYKAHEESLHRHVALKVLGEHLAADDDAVERFVREARAAARLSHPNIVQIYAISEDAGRHFFAMEYVAGRSLQQILRAEGPLEPLRAARLMVQAAAGLEAAHEQGIIHRDIKPANLMVDGRGLLKVADFGLALAAGGAMSRLTATGMFMGTPGYLSPEQCLDQGIDHRTDIYSLGVSFYEALSGRMPFTADSPLALINKIIRVDPPDIAELNPAVGAPLRAILARMMAKEREQRYQSCAEVLADLRTAIGGGVEDPATLAAGSVGVALPAPRPTEAVRLETQPTQHMPSAVGTVPPPPPPPPVPSASPPPAPAGAGATEVMGSQPSQPVPELAPIAAGAATTTQRRRSPLLLALIAVAVVLAGVAVAAVLAVRSGWFGRGEGGHPPASTTAAAALAAVTPSAVAEPSSSATPCLLEESPASAAVTTPARGTEAAPVNPAVAEPRPVATAAGGPPQSARTAAPPAATPDLERGRAPATTPEPKAATDGTVVVALGDPLLAGEVEAFIERGLALAGEPIVDERGIAGFEPPEAAPADRGELLALRAHARHLVVARIEVVGQRELRFMGRADVASRAQVAISLIDLESEQRVGAPLMAEVEYTRLTVERAVAKALRPRMPRLIEAVR